ncbi:MAG: hypothetical protein ACYS7Y_05970 [Planctomycetota bacterium]
MKVRLVVSISIILCLVGGVSADTRWNAATNNLWTNPANWDNGIPDATQKTTFGTSEVCILDVAGAEAKHIAMDGAGAGYLRLVDGAELNVKDWTIVGYSASNVGDMACRIEVLGGVFNSEVRCFVGFQGEGTLIVDGDGVFNVLSQDFGVGQQATGVGTVELRGGELNVAAGNLSLRNGVSANIDFSGGILTQQANPARIDYINAAIADGIMTAYSGQGEVVVDTNEVPGEIVVRGLHNLRPAPADGGATSIGEVDLSWTLPDPCSPGEPVAVDVYFTDDLNKLMQFTDPASMQVVNKSNVTSVAVQTVPKTQYYWAVDTYVGSGADPVFGPIFTFVADNQAPVVQVETALVTTWVTDGTVDVSLGATVTDDGAAAPAVTWSVVSEPNEAAATIGDPAAEDTVVTLTETGQYVLQVLADDGEYSASTEVTVNVYVDSCEAAKSLPDFELLVGDLNADCVVNELDMALLEENWLACNALDCGEDQQ